MNLMEFDLSENEINLEDLISFPNLVQLRISANKIVTIKINHNHNHQDKRIKIITHIE